METNYFGRCFMFRSADILIGKNTIEINDSTYILGELTADFLNLDNTKLEKMHKLFKKVLDFATKKEGIPTKEEYHKIDKAMHYIDQELAKMKIFKSIREETFNIFHETNPVSENEILDVIKNSKLSLDKEQADIFYGMFAPDGDIRWKDHLDWIYRYKTFFDDIVAVGATIQHFLYHFAINDNQPLTENSYAEAYYEMVVHPRREKFIVGPCETSDMSLGYTTADKSMISFVPAENINGDMEIFKLYTVTTLQAIIKLDFFGAINAGHIIRRCKHCKKYFVLTSLYKTLYCDGISPVNPKYSCQQMGSTEKKELSENYPYSREKKRLISLANMHLARDIISQDDCDKIKSIINDLHYKAMKQLFRMKILRT